jgi:hypothetical protein
VLEWGLFVTGLFVPNKQGFVSGRPGLRPLPLVCVCACCVPVVGCGSLCRCAGACSDVPVLMMPLLAGWWLVAVVVNTVPVRSVSCWGRVELAVIIYYTINIL